MSYESQSGHYYLESLQSELAVLRRQVEDAETELREDCAQLMIAHEESLEDFVSMTQANKEANEKIKSQEAALHCLKEKMLQEKHLKLTLSVSEMIFSQQMEDQTSNF